MQHLLHRRSVLSLAALALTVAAAACVPAPRPSAEASPTRVILFPVNGKTTFSDTFGAGRSGGRSHAGQDLMAARHTPIVSPVDGTVTRVRHDSTGLSGNMLVVTDAEGWRYTFIHLNNDRPGTDDGFNRFDQAFADGMRSGQKVRAGELLGWVGDSGNAETTSPHLHFEMQAPDGTVVNPYPSIKAAQRNAMTAQDMAAAAPFGLVDSYAGVGGGVLRVQGWAIDRALDTSVVVSVYVDGNPVATGTADGSRPDLGQAFGRGEQHGFAVSTPALTAGAHQVCVVAHNAGAGGSARIGCADVTV